MNKKTKFEYLCTRPTLASRLMNNGYNGKQTTNPYNPKRKAWIFEGEKSSIMEIVNRFYAELRGGKA